MNTQPNLDFSKAYVITGPTSGLGKEATFALARFGTLVLVGRNMEKLKAVVADVEKRGGKAIAVVCDMADLNSVKQAAEDILSLHLPITGLLNNAGIQNPKTTKTAAGHDMTFVTNHLGPFALTDILLPHLKEGANVLFIGSATEDPERVPARRAGFRGGRYISVEASAKGEWLEGGSIKPGMDAYATSKQCNTAAALGFAREYPRLNIMAMEPGIMFNTGLHNSMSMPMVMLGKVLVPILALFVKVLSTPKRAARIVTRVLTSTEHRSGTYFDESGEPMRGSTLVHDEHFQDRVLQETRAYLRTAKG